LQEDDSRDLGQEVFFSVARGIAGFHHNRSGDTFRGWLHTITKNKIRDRIRDRVRRERHGDRAGQAGVIWPEVPAPEDPSSEETAQDNSMVVQRAVEVISAEFEERSGKAFWRVAVDRQDPRDVARDLGMSVNAVYLAKSRILRRLREEFEGLIDF
jgi:RNA polymerase sigma-70 factor, ECF subfamily